MKNKILLGVVFILILTIIFLPKEIKKASVSEEKVDVKESQIFVRLLDEQTNTITEENLEDYSVIIYVVKNGDSLWKIAKRFGSTVDDIARVNGMERPDRLMAGEKIYIPKYVLKKAKEPIVLSQGVGI